MAIMNNDYQILQRFIELKDWIKANSGDTPTESLTSLRIGNTTYSISGGGGGGGVTSVDLQMPQGFVVTSQPITTSGILTVQMANGYIIPNTTETGKWNSLTFNPTVPTGITPTSLTTILYNNTYYSIESGGGGGSNVSATNTLPSGKIAVERNYLKIDDNYYILTPPLITNSSIDELF